MPKYTYQIMGADNAGSLNAPSIDAAYVKVLEMFGTGIDGICIAPIIPGEIPIKRDFNHVREVKHQLFIKYSHIRSINHRKYLDSFEDIMFQDDIVAVKQDPDSVYKLEYCYVNEQPQFHKP